MAQISHPESPQESFATDLYNPAPMLTFEGAAFLVITLSGVAGYIFEFNPRWLGLLISVAIAYLGLAFLPTASRPYRTRNLIYALYRR